MDEDTEAAAWAQLEMEQELRADPANELRRTQLEKVHDDESERTEL